MMIKVVNGNRIVMNEQEVAEMASLQSVDEAMVLIAKRNEAFLTRPTFLNVCEGFGIIDEATAIAAADGSWPASFEQFITDLTLSQKLEAKSTWADNQNVRRTNSILFQIAAFYIAQTNLTRTPDDLLDEMFNIT